MPRFVAKLLYLAPVLVFGLAASFVAASYYLGASPADPIAWQSFLALTPLVRDPVNLVARLSHWGFAGAFVFFAGMTFLGIRLAVSPLGTGRSLFIYAHISILTLYYSMRGAGVFAAGDLRALANPAAVGWMPDFTKFPPFGVALLAAVAVACAVSHIIVLKRTLRYRRELRARRSAPASGIPTS
jgi:hypothetical protein